MDTKVKCLHCGELVWETELNCPKCGCLLKKSAHDLRQEAEKAKAEKEEAARREEESRKLKESAEVTPDDDGFPRARRGVPLRYVTIPAGLIAVTLVGAFLYHRAQGPRLTAQRFMDAAISSKDVSPYCGEGEDGSSVTTYEPLSYRIENVVSNLVVVRVTASTFSPAGDESSYTHQLLVKRRKIVSIDGEKDKRQGGKDDLYF